MAEEDISGIDPSTVEIPDQPLGDEENDFSGLEVDDPIEAAPEPEPEPEEAPEPTPAPEPEPEDAEIDLSWLDEPPPKAPEPSPAPAQTPQSPPMPPQYPPQYPQGPPPPMPVGMQPPAQGPPQGPMTNEQFLEAFLRDPQSTINQIKTESAREAIGQFAPRIMDIEKSQRAHHDARMSEVSTRVMENISNNVREHVAKDDGYRGSPEVKSGFQETVRTMKQNAMDRARYLGDFSELQNFGDPDFYKVALYAAKLKAGYRSAIPGGFDAKEVQAEPAKRRVEPTHNIRLNEDTKEALSRLGAGAEQAAIENLSQWGDRFQFED